MITAYPSLEWFQRNAICGRWSVFLQEIDTNLSPQEAYASLQVKGNGEPSFLLESSRYHEVMGRYSFVLTQPRSRFRPELHWRNPLEHLRWTLQEFSMIDLSRDFAPMELPPFLGGAVGLLNYELKNSIERFSLGVDDVQGIPSMDLALFDKGYIYDHKERRVFSFLLHCCESGDERDFERGRDLCHAWTSQFPLKSVVTPSLGMVFIENDAEHRSQAKQKFITNVERAKRYIREGEIFQANLSQVLRWHVEGNAWPQYCQQVQMNPTCFSAYADMGDYVLLSGSPERLVQVKNGAVSTRPIAGTRPRSENAIEDERYKSELRLSPKERAEHVMLIDLERNDLGRVCEYGTVDVNEFMVLEDYSHVRHIVSNVTGQLREGQDIVDVIRATFPGGTITGAPKVRAMEIIDELEGQTRGVYTGSLGYMGFHGNSDFNIVIRSLFVQNNVATLQVGAGIVADSDPEREYEETLHKANAFLQVLNLKQQKIMESVS